MKITVTFGEIMAAMPAVEKLLEREFTAPGTPVKLAMIHRFLVPVAQDIEKQRAAIVEETAERDEAGEVVYLDSDKKSVRTTEAMAERLTALYETKFEDLDIPALTPDDLAVASGKALKGIELYPLVPFLKVI